MPKLRHTNYTLTPKAIAAAKPADKPYVMTDGGGLYLDVLPGGSKVWRYTYRLGGKRPKLTIGPYPQWGIAEARNRHEELRAMVAKGVDPVEEKKEAQREAAVQSEAKLPFSKYALVWVRETLFYRSDSYRAQNIRFLDAYINPFIGDLPIEAVTPAHVLKIMRAKADTPTTADRCRVIIQQVFSYAIRNLVLDSNPATAVRGAVSVPPKKHHAHLGEAQLGAFWRELERQRTATIITATAAKLLLLTMTRKGELRLAKWEEFDLDAAVWSIPAERMKMRKPHRVFLSRQAVDLLRMLHKVSGHEEYAFPTRFVGGRGRPIGDVTLNHFFKRLDFGVPEFSPHGTRSTASTLLREAGHPRDVVEAMLAHQIEDAVEAAYNRAEFVEQKKVAYQWLADRIDQLAAGGQVIPLRA